MPAFFDSPIWNPSKNSRYSHFGSCTTLNYAVSRKRHHMNPSSSDRYALALPLLIWVASFFLPTITFPANGWFFHGTHPGIVAAILSLFYFGFGLVELRQLRAHPAQLLFCFYVGALALGNLLMLASLWTPSRVRIREGRGFIVFLWVWLVLSAACPYVFQKFSNDGSRLEFGVYVWILSIFFMALIMTALYLQRARTAPPSPVTRSR